MAPPNDRTILVTGATGKQGGAAARFLLDAGYPVRAMTRNPESEPAARLRARGAEVVYGDLDDPASLEEPLTGAWGALSVQNTWEAGVEREEEQGKRFAETAREAGVHHLVYASVGSAHRNTGIPHFENKWRIEERVRELGFPSHTVVRPVFFMENFLAPQMKEDLLQGRLRMALRPEAFLQMIAVEDVGRFHFLAFERWEELSGEALDVAGDELTMPEVARLLGQINGLEVTFQQQPIEEVRKWSEDYALMMEWFDRVGYDADIEAMERRFDLRLKRFRQWVKEVEWP